MPGPYTSADLLDQVRAQVDEQNTESVTDAQVYASLNRAQRKAANRLMTQYPDLFLTFTTFTTTVGDTYPIPVNAYGRRVKRVLVVRNTIESKVDRVAATDLYKYTSSAVVAIPRVYALVGRDMVIKPTPQTGVSFKVWYPAAPETIVKPLGRITTVSVAGTYVLVDAVDSTLSTDVASLAAYVNVVDGPTGYVKATMQVSAVNASTKQVSFKTSGVSAAAVYNRTVATALPSGNAATAANVNEQDYLCAVQGTCVPDLPDACLDFLVQFSVNDIKRLLGESVTDEKTLLDELEAEVASQWAGREAASRIMNRAAYWTR